MSVRTLNSCQILIRKSKNDQTIDVLFSSSSCSFNKFHMKYHEFVLSLDHNKCNSIAFKVDNGISLKNCIVFMDVVLTLHVPVKSGTSY